MPQLFNVLKCYKCSVFQVHQTKKSSRWECKLCGQKQSMKRHYGLGTGKECRLHVQKLNGIRGEIDENNETGKLNESSDDEMNVKHDTKVFHKKPANFESKWSEFVEKTEEPEPNKSMYLGNAEVVLEVPAKRRKFTKSKTAKDAPTPNNYTSKLDDLNNIGNLPASQSSQLPSSPPIQFYKTQNANTQNKLKKVSHEDEFIMLVGPQAHRPTGPKKQHLNNFVPPKVDKDSKWSQFMIN